MPAPIKPVKLYQTTRRNIPSDHNYGMVFILCNLAQRCAYAGGQQDGVPKGIEKIKAMLLDLEHDL